MVGPGTSPAFFAYATCFVAAATACGVSLRRATRIEDADTRRGLVGLLASSGAWAALQSAFLVVGGEAVDYVLYTLSLVVGLTTVGAWLYFCSAYTGRTFHRSRPYRRAAVAVYGLIVVLKLTNPVHGLYFSTAFVEVPFPHLTVSHGVLHWLVTGLSYVLAAVGFFMLYELFLEAEYDTRPLGALVAVTGLPVALDMVGFASPLLLDVNYEPLGVAVFALGVLYAFDERFFAVQVSRGVDDPIVYLSDDGRIREYNDGARRLFPALDDATGEQLAAALPAVAERLDAGEAVLELDDGGDRRYYLASETEFSIGQTDLGRLIAFTDVTETERQRREVRRHNEQLEEFVVAIRHELLNTLQLVDGWVRTAGRALDAGDVEGAREALATAGETSERMGGLVHDFANLAEHGQTVERTDLVGLEATARRAFATSGTDDVDLIVAEDRAVEADPHRLGEMFRTVFEFVTDNDATTVRVVPRESGFVVEDDGEVPAQPTAAFEYGNAVPDSDRGRLLPILATLARAHGWTARIDPEYEGGLRVVVESVTVDDPAPESVAE